MNSSRENTSPESKIDTAVAEAYEAALVPGLFKPWAEAIVTRAALTPESNVLDVACGTGIATRHVANLVRARGKAVGVDIDPGMIEIAQRIATQDGVNAEYLVGSASELPVESASFDVALCFQGLQYFPDRLKAIAELHRVLKSNAKLIIATWGDLDNCKGHWALVHALERRGIDASATRHPFVLSGHDAVHSLVHAAGFKEISVRTEERLAKFASSEAFVNAVAKGAPTSRHALAKVSSKDWPGFLQEVDVALAPWKVATGIAFPMENNILEATR